MLDQTHLAHQFGQIRNAYNRAEYIERRRPLMAWWSDYIENAGAGNVGLAGNVMEFKAG